MSVVSFNRFAKVTKAERSALLDSLWTEDENLLKQQREIDERREAIRRDIRELLV